MLISLVTDPTQHFPAVKMNRSVSMDPTQCAEDELPVRRLYCVFFPIERLTIQGQLPSVAMFPSTIRLNESLVLNQRLPLHRKFGKLVEGLKMLVGSVLLVSSTVLATDDPVENIVVVVAQKVQVSAKLNGNARPLITSSIQSIREDTLA